MAFPMAFPKALPTFILSMTNRKRRDSSTTWSNIRGLSISGWAVTPVRFRMTLPSHVERKWGTSFVNCAQLSNTFVRDVSSNKPAFHRHARIPAKRTYAEKLTSDEYHLNVSSRRDG